MKGNIYGFRDDTLSLLLYNAIYLEPLNLFLYTWRFCETLAREETNEHIKSFYFWFSWCSICLIPAAYYGVYAGFVVEYGRYYEYYFLGKQYQSEADSYE